MSSAGIPPTGDLPEGLDLPPEDSGSSPPPPTSPRRRGNASVALRRGEGDQGEAASLDPATKSLADALRVTFRLLQAAMVVLVVLYLLSGFQTVKESEKGIRLLFGRVVASNLPPGFQFSLPAPFGQLVKVQTGLQTEEIKNQFFPHLSEPEERMLVDKDKGVSSLAGGSDSLDPDADGQLLTADGNIAHARWSVTYQRVEAAKNAQNINPDNEAEIVEAAACRGIVQAAASLPIDDLLKKQSDSSAQSGLSKVETIARDVAQKALDEMESGIQITSLTMNVVMPPRNVMKAFQDVAAATTQAGKALEEARNYRNDKLTEAAGTAASTLLTLIDRYDHELAQSQRDRAAQTLDTIDKVMQRQPVQIEGAGGEGADATRVSGDVSRIIDDATQYRTSVVNRAKSSADLFEAKRTLFKSNPLVMIYNDWADAYSTFLGADTTQAIYLPPDVARQVLLINKDPAVARDIEQKLIRAENEKAQKARELQRNRARFEERMNAESRTREQ